MSKWFFPIVLFGFLSNISFVEATAPELPGTTAECNLSKAFGDRPTSNSTVTGTLTLDKLCGMDPHYNYYSKLLALPFKSTREFMGDLRLTIVATKSMSVTMKVQHLPDYQSVISQTLTASPTSKTIVLPGLSFFADQYRIILEPFVKPELKGAVFSYSASMANIQTDVAARLSIAARNSAGELVSINPAAAPSVSNGRDFGVNAYTSSCGSVNRTLHLKNSGNADLTIEDVSVGAPFIDIGGYDSSIRIPSPIPVGRKILNPGKVFEFDIAISNCPVNVNKNSTVVFNQNVNIKYSGLGLGSSKVFTFSVKATTKRTN